MALKPWCRVLYWFAMLIDAERIDREVQELNTLHEAELGAVGFHEPERLWRARERALARLQARRTMTVEELIAYAREAQRKARGLVN